MNAENWVILVTVVSYLVFMLWIGYRVSRRIRGIDSYILAGRNLPWFVLGLTFLATIANTNQVLGQPGFAYQNGLSYLFWTNAAALTIGAILLPRIGTRLRGMNLSTIVDLAQKRFPGSKRVHYLVLLWQAAWAVFLTALSLFGAALLIEVVTGLSWQVNIVIIALVTIVYTVLGGLRAVVITDSVQWMIIIFSVAIFVPLIFLREGPFSSFFANYLGPSGLSTTRAAEDTNLFAGFTDLFTLPPELAYVPSLIAFVLAVSLWVPIDLGFVQRMLAARDAQQGRLGAYTYLGLQFFVLLLLVTLGMYGAVLVRGIDNPDEVIVVLARDTLPLFGAALFVSAVAAAAMSTMSTYLNAGSSIIVRNLILDLKPDLSEERRLMLSRVFTAVFCLIAISFAPFISNAGIVAAAVAIQMILVAALSPLILLAIFWKRLTERGAFWGCLVASIVTFILMFVEGGPTAAFASPGPLGIPVLFWGAAAGGIFFVGASLLEPYRPENTSPEFQEIFEGRTPGVPNTDLKVMGTLWLVLILLTAYKTTVGSDTAFPPLGSGLGGFLTDAFYMFVAVAVFGASVYMVVRLYGYIREEVAPEAPEGASSEASREEPQSG
ncbi:MAG: sodium:solute symporter [Rubrobacteraceae bacterium]